MPYVNVKITNEGVTAKQKAEVIKGVTKLLQDVLGKDPATTFVVIDEVDLENWGVRGEQFSEIRKQANKNQGEQQ